MFRHRVQGFLVLEGEQVAVVWWPVYFEVIHESGLGVSYSFLFCPVYRFPFFVSGFQPREIYVGHFQPVNVFRVELNIGRFDVHPRVESVKSWNRDFGESRRSPKGRGEACVDRCVPRFIRVQVLTDYGEIC